METQAVHQKRTRAQVLRDSVQIRIAIDETGPIICELLRENGLVIPAADWTRVFPNWLIACVDDEVIGCIQVMPAKPVAWCQMLFVKPAASFKLRAIAVRKLLMAAVSTAHAYGASYLAGAVDTSNRKFGDILKKHNVVTLSTADLVAKGLYVN